MDAFPHLLTGLPVVKPIETRMGAMMAMHIESTAPGNLREFRLPPKLLPKKENPRMLAPCWLPIGGHELLKLLILLRRSNRAGISPLSPNESKLWEVGPIAILELAFDEASDGGSFPSNDILLPFCSIILPWLFSVLDFGVESLNDDKPLPKMLPLRFSENWFETLVTAKLQ